MRLSRRSVGLALRCARSAAELSASDLAVLVDMSASSLSRTESGQRDLEFTEALAVARVLGVPVSAFQDLVETFEREGDDPSQSRLSEIQRELIELQRQAIEVAIHGAVGKRA
jgi:transcriptional regulator with XRE-family HTH domain